MRRPVGLGITALGPDAGLLRGFVTGLEAAATIRIELDDPRVETLADGDRRRRWLEEDNFTCGSQHRYRSPSHWSIRSCVDSITTTGGQANE